LTKRPENRRAEGAAPRVAGWFRARLDLDPALALVRRHPVPMHRHSWIYCLGDAAVFLFVWQVLSGVLLMLYYQPTDATAHESVQRIMTEVPYGWLIRSVHAWGASLLIGITALHLITVLFARAYRAPRELAWISGVVMLAIALASGFSGYLLPWNERSYFATLVGTQMPGTLPGVGDSLVRLLRGGDQISSETITRFFAAHVMLAPMAMVALLSIHVLLTRIRGLSLPPGVGKQDVRDRRPFFAEFLLIDACVWLVLLGTIATLAVLLPAEVGNKADPLKPAPEGVKPEWYFLFAFQALKLLPEAVGVALLAVAGFLLLVLPFLVRPVDRATLGRGLTVVYTVALAGVTALQVVAWASPGVDRPPETLAAETYSLSGGLVSLVFLWSVIGFLVFYLWRLVKERTRVRSLYSSSP